MPTSPATSSFAAVTQALPGPTIRSTGAKAGWSRRRRPAERERRRSPGRRRRRGGRRRRGARPRRGAPGGRAPSASAGEATTIDVDAGDPGRHDRHDERRRVRGRAAGDVAADAVEGQPAPLDLDARRRSSCGVVAGRWVSANAADVVDRLRRARRGRRGSSRSTAARSSRRGRGRAGRRRARRRTARWPRGPRPRRGSGRRRGSPARSARTALVGDRAAPEEGSPLGDASGRIVRREVEPAEADRVAPPASASRAARRVTGRSSRSGGRGSRMRRPP